MRVCEDCESVEESCCAASKARRETAISLAKIVTRQSDRINILVLELHQARTEIGGLRKEIASWRGAHV